MKKRIRKDLVITWKDIKTNHELVDLNGRDLSLQVINPRGKESFVDFEVVDNYNVRFTLYGTLQDVLGVYSISLWENYNSKGMTVVDKPQAFELVSNTTKEDPSNTDSLTLDTIDIEGGNIEVGLRGLSAYEIAVKHGFVGAEEEWLKSLKGEKGESGNINYPTFRIDNEMHLQMNTESASNKDRFKIDDKGNLILTI